MRPTVIHLVTDSTAYLPSLYLDERRIYTVPLKVTLDGQAVDEDQLDLDAFYNEYLVRVDKAPTTSQPAPGEFIQLYQELVQDGGEVLSIHISSGLSGTLQSAQLAAGEVAPDRITIVDSRVATCGLMMMVLAAADALAQGKTRAEVADWVTRMSRAQASVFLVEDLNYLAKGGRINGATKFLGSMLRLRPILFMNEGKIDGLGTTRSRSRGIAQIMDEVSKRVGDGPIYGVVTHIRCAEEAHTLAEHVRQRFQCVRLSVNETGPVIGSHVGPGFIGFSACRADV